MNREQSWGLDRGTMDEYAQGEYSGPLDMRMDGTFYEHGKDPEVMATPPQDLPQHLRIGIEVEPLRRPRTGDDYPPLPTHTPGGERPAEATTDALRASYADGDRYNRKGRRQHTPQWDAVLQQPLASNGLAWRPVRCGRCQRFLGDEGILLGMFRRECPNCGFPNIIEINRVGDIQQLEQRLDTKTAEDGRSTEWQGDAGRTDDPSPGYTLEAKAPNVDNFRSS